MVVSRFAAAVGENPSVPAFTVVVPVAVIAPYAPRGIDRLVAEGRATLGRPFEPREPSLSWPLDRSTTEIVSEGREDRF